MKLSIDELIICSPDRLREVRARRRPQLGHQDVELQPAADPVGGRHHGVQQGPRVPRPQVSTIVELSNMYPKD